MKGLVSINSNNDFEQPIFFSDFFQNCEHFLSLLDFVFFGSEMHTKKQVLIFTEIECSVFVEIQLIFILFMEILSFISNGILSEDYN